MKKYLSLTALLVMLCQSILAAPRVFPEVYGTDFDRGPFIATCIGQKLFDEDATLKGLVIKVGDNDEYRVVFDTALLQFRAAWKGKTRMSGFPWDGRHKGFPAAAGEITWWSKSQPGWALNGSTEDPRSIPYGVLPKDYGQYKGHYKNGDKVVLHYVVQGAEIFETPELINPDGKFIVTRSFNIEDTGKGLELLVVDIQEKVALPGEAGKAKLFLDSNNKELKFKREANGRVLVSIPAGKKDFKFSLFHSKKSIPASLQNREKTDLKESLKGGTAQWPERIKVKTEMGDGEGPYITDHIPVPNQRTNPYKTDFRSGGFDFFSDGKSAAFCDLNGDIWLCTGLEGDFQNVEWRKIASGLFECLGLKIVDDKIYVTGKDQITKLHDLNGDGEIDYYECFNNDIMITHNFHEFTFDLDTDKDGNFYIAKASPVKGGGRGFDATQPHNGVIFKISPDGKKSEVVANGLRAPGGLGISPDGVLTTGENEGTYVPACKITWSEGGEFHGVRHDGNKGSEKKGVAKPLVWLPMWVDNSGASQIWLENDKFGPFKGDMLHLSYGQSAVYKASVERVDGQVQGAVVKLPIKLYSSAMRPRVNPVSQEMYILGFKGYQTNAVNNCAFQRVRYTGETPFMPDEVKTLKNGLVLEFTEELNPEQVFDIRSYQISRWNFHYSEQYGSGTFSLDVSKDLLDKYSKTESKGIIQMKDPVALESVSLLKDKKSIFIEFKEMKPADTIEISLNLSSKSGKSFKQKIYKTVHKLPAEDIAKTEIVRTEKIVAKPINWSDYKPGAIAEFRQPIDVDVNSESVINKDQKVLRLPSLKLAKDELPGFNLKPGAYQYEIDCWVHFKEVGMVQFDVDCTYTKGKTPKHFMPILSIDGNEFFPKRKNRIPTVTMPAGLHKINIRGVMESTKAENLRILWKWENGPWEPIPPELVFHKSTKEIEKSNKFRHGRELVGTMQCTSCHDSGSENGMPELAERGPNLKNISSLVNPSWMQEWLKDPKNLKPHSRMPNVLMGDEQKASDIVAYLFKSQNKDVVIEQKFDDKLVAHGTSLYKELGCIACHSRPDKNEFEEGKNPLHFVNWKYKPGALAKFLMNPEANHADTRMPNFLLSQGEAEAIAAFLRKSSKDFTPGGKSAVKGDATRGKFLLASAGCADCHQTDLESTLKAPSLADLKSTMSTCYEKGLYDFNLTKNDSVAIKTTLDDQKHFSQHILHESSARAVKQLNCNACHASDGTPDQFSSRLSLITDLKNTTIESHLAQDRPPLTYLGEQLKTDYMEKVLTAKVENKARPWLKARMPAFTSRAARLAHGLSAQHGIVEKDDNPKFKEPLAETGHKLVGATGFSCIVCHGVGPNKPLAAFEVEGINLGQLRERMTWDYYLRWMYDPTRVISHTKMPKYHIGNNKSALSNVLGGEADKQFEAIWHYLKEGMKSKKPLGMP